MSHTSILAQNWAVVSQQHSHRVGWLIHDLHRSACVSCVCEGSKLDNMLVVSHTERVERAGQFLYNCLHGH